MKEGGIVFNVQPFSIQDGPGIRTTVFFKGCNLRCVWCHNPESWKKQPELQFYPEECIACGTCFAVCPYGVHELNAQGVHTLDREYCTVCGICADQCYAGALKMIGKLATAEEIWKQIQQDIPYYQKSGGGITVSGGECMLQTDFLADLLPLCKANNVHTAVDTAGHLPFCKFEQVMPFTDLFLYDIKALDPALHQTLTGVDGTLIWENLRRLLEVRAAVIVRIPCVLGANWDDLKNIANALASLPPLQRLELLPYHRLGEGKFSALGRQADIFGVPSNLQMEELAAFFCSQGLEATFTPQ